MGPWFMQKNLNDVFMLVGDRRANEPWLEAPEGGIVFVRRAQEHEILDIHELTKREISADVAPLSVVQDVYKRNRDTFWTVNRASDVSKQDAQMVGYVGLLILNEIGRERLEAGAFDAHEPDIRLLVPSNTRPAAIYVWAIIARKVAKHTAHLMAHAMGPELYAGVPLFATAGTLGGLNLMKGYGFSGARASGGGGLGQLFRLDQVRGAAVSSSAA
jgi:hypothetical protein